MKPSARPRLATAATIVTTFFLALGAGPAHAADTVVQIPMTGVLDARCVITLTGGNIVPFTQTIDGGGTNIGDGPANLQNGFATKAVATMKNAAEVGNSLPDDGFFAMNAKHPDVRLHYSNDDATSPQTHMVKPTGGTFSFPVPSATYSKLYVFFHAAAGGTMVKLTLTYADATTQVVNAMIPDYYNDPTDPAVFVLAPNLAKWTKTATINEASHHNIFGVETTPMAKTLASVQVDRGASGYLVFWGATGIATTAVSIPDGGTDAGPTTDASGAGGTTGAAGSVGSTGAAGTSGAAGSVGSTGAAGTTGAAGSVGSTGAAGTSGAAGSVGSTGAAGTTGAAGSGAAGASSTGTGGSKAHGGSSGCAIAAGAGTTRLGALALLGLALVAAARRRRQASRRAR